MRKALEKQKKCNRCSNIFKPTSRHLSCPKCRMTNRSKNKTCGLCDKNIDNNSSLCVACNNTQPSRVKPYELKKKTITPKGYCKFSNGVFEHRYIMEQKLGRPLRRSENVHHINGIRTDNRLENLELWVTNQPSGQRVEDLLKWAHEIINLYDSKKAQ